MAITADTPVPTSSQWVLAETLTEGDLVFDDKGIPQTITKIQHYTPEECYEVTFDDGTTLHGDKRLTLMCQDKIWRDRLIVWMKTEGKTHRKKMRRPLKAVKVGETTKEDLHHKTGRIMYSVPNCLPVRYPDRTLPVPPYVLGVWFATRTPSGYHWVKGRPVDKINKEFRKHGFFLAINQPKTDKRKFEIRPSVRDSFLFADAPIPTTVPFSYVESSLDQRKDFLRGMIDGGAIKRFGNTDKFTLNDADYHYLRRIQCLVESLGLKSRIITSNLSSNYRLEFRTKDDFSVLYGTNRRFLHKIEKIAPKKCVHIETERPFLVGEGFIPAC